MQIGEPFYLDITANSSEPDTAVSPELKKKMVESEYPIKIIEI